ncbi:hypothetical protein EC957_009284 [Mortierella hygrophila]|uniref:K Homology domain-containing protein n=1 Tax=Mortierella hygrophila TaxID=979708 RepID=A0A9P6K580_9FUNG|nr:hypothetical protein EC957_009284 [Mortierella hygrophila]
MSDTEKTSVEEREKKRSLPTDDSDDHDSDSEDRRHKRAAVNDSNSSSPQRPQHRRRNSDDASRVKADGAEGDIPPTTALRSIVSTKDAGVIIGKSGKNVSEIREQSGAKVTISEMIPGAYERILTVSGPLDTVAKAYSLVAQKVIAEHIEPDAAPETESTAIRLLVAHHRMGSVIGKLGSKIKEIQEASGARLVASEEILPASTERTITITGVPDAIHIAVYHVGVVLQEHSERDRNASVIPYRPMGRSAFQGPPAGGMGGYPPHHGSSSHHHHQQPYYGGYPSHGGMGYGQDYMPPSSSRGGSGGHGGYSGSGGAAGGAGGMSGGPGSVAQQIFIPNDMVGSVIGKGGSKINEIRQMSGSHIKIAEPQNNGANERLVTITGTPESNQMAIYMLYQRLESEKARQ